VSEVPGVAPAAAALAIGHAQESAVHVSIFRLDAQGQPLVEEPRPLTLPKPASLAGYKTQILGLACHPRFPLLYVWQDVEPNPIDGTQLNPALATEFDHLFVYSLEEAQPKLLMATARGPDFGCGNLAGGFTLDASSGRLYVPNLRRIAPNKNYIGAIGWVAIDPDGLPAPSPPPTAAGAVTGAAAPPPATVSLAPLDPAAAAAARAAKLASWGVQVPRVTAEVVPQTFDFACPYSYAPISDKVVMLAGYAGPVSWVLDDRLGRFNYLYVQPYVPNRYRVAVHPTLPSVYMTTVTYDGHLLRFEHADGYLTLAPQTLYVDNAVIHTPPIVIAKRGKLAFGAASRICVIDLNAEGRFTTQGAQMTINNLKPSGVAWSDRFERLYVAVEKTP
jgi:hypothetical protein